MSEIFQELQSSQQSTVLVIDDEADIRESLQDIFETEGYRVFSFGDGRKALSLLEGGLRPDLILLDLMMPHMSGAEFVELHKVNLSLPRAPIVVMSADNQVAGRAKTLGVSGFIKKPLDLDGLLALVKKYEKPLGLGPNA